MIKVGVDLNPPDAVSPLYLAVSMKSTKLVKLLIDNGADVNYEEPTESYPVLMHAIACHSSLELVGLLIKHGAKLETEEYSSLCEAIYH